MYERVIMKYIYCIYMIYGKELFDFFNRVPPVVVVSLDQFTRGPSINLKSAALHQGNPHEISPQYGQIIFANVLKSQNAFPYGFPNL